ncbi:hypothetical protein ACH42_04570 [Endozoicomonas sp. (ex Bugula neritina AB1)]|nr:hypothetical protein ACH42_04570 [Endozoicomonas sp. (ex Bugula neritina AB1)]
MMFEYPERLWLLLLIPVVVVYWWKRRRETGLEYSYLPLLVRLPVSLRQHLRWFPELLHITALGLILVALAQPYRSVTIDTDKEEGIAIAVVVDVSSSMSIHMDIGGKRMSRLAVARKVLKDFITGDGETLKGRSSDLLSLITFARYPTVLSPLSSSHQAVASLVGGIKISLLANADGTAFGDAAALGAAQLSEYERAYGLDKSVTSKVMILLTDGENNSGKYSPIAAAAMAKEWGVKIYTISLGDRPKEEAFDAGNLSMDDIMSNADWILKAMADTTGGIFQRAYDYDSLRNVYGAIDKLETSRLHTFKYEDRQPIFHWLALLALCCMMLSISLSATWLRRLA